MPVADRYGVDLVFIFLNDAVKKVGEFLIKVVLSRNLGFFGLHNGECSLLSPIKGKHRFYSDTIEGVLSSLIYFFNWVIFY